MNKKTMLITLIFMLCMASLLFLFSCRTSPSPEIPNTPETPNDANEIPPPTSSTSDKKEDFKILLKPQGALNSIKENHATISVGNPTIQAQAIFDTDKLPTVLHGVIIVDTMQKLEEIYPAIVADYDEDFFEDRVLMLSSYQHGSGLYVLGVNAIYIKNGKLYPVWNTNNPESVASDIKFTVVSAEIQRSELETLDLAITGGEIVFLHDYIDAQK